MLENTNTMVEFTDVIVRIASTVLLSLICWAVKEGIAWLKTKTQNDRLKAALDELQRVTIDGIYFIEQTSVKAFKENGTWDVDTQEEVLAECRDYILNTLTEEAKVILTEDNTQALTDLITSKIEAELGFMHQKPTITNIDIPIAGQSEDNG